MIRSNFHAQNTCCETTREQHTERINDLLNACCTSYELILPNIRATNIWLRLEENLAASKQTFRLLQKHMIGPQELNIIHDNTRCCFLLCWRSSPQDKCIHVHILKFLARKPMHFSKSGDKHTRTSTYSTAFIRGNMNEIWSVSDMKRVKFACAGQQHINLVFWEIMLHGESAHNSKRQVLVVHVNFYTTLVYEIQISCWSTPCSTERANALDFKRRFFAWAPRIVECNAWCRYNLHELRIGLSERSPMIELAAFVSRSASINEIM